MNPFISKVIINTVLNEKEQNKSKQESDFNEEDLENGFKEFLITLKRILKDTILITAGVFAAGFGLRGFLLPNDFIDGGAMGISLLIYELTKIPLSILIIVINLPFIVLGIRVINKTFAFKTILAIILLAIVIAIIPFPQITSDKLLISIFGGFFLGTGIGLAIRGGSVIDGTEILAIYVSRRLGTSIGDIIMAINIIVFLFAACLISVETAMYAMLTYLSASKTVDFITEGFEEYIGVTIISDFSDEIQHMIKYKMKRGFTVYTQKKGTGKKGDNKTESEVVYTVITRLEIGKLYSELEIIDSDAFIVTQSVRNIKGGMVKKRPLH
ncbi:MAG TPA: YitT family protein [Chitinophagales bacterium]|nr:YitT family protein [Chitinophagales bacterium]